MPYRFRVEWTGLGGAPYLTTHYFQGGGTATPEALATALATYYNLLRQNVSDRLTYTLETECVEFSAPDTPVGVIPVTSFTGTGAAAAGVCALSTQGLIKLDTQSYRGARRVQGRIFIPGPTVNFLNGLTGTPSAAYVAALTAAGTDLVEMGAVVASRTANQFYPATSAAGWNKFAVLRSRRD